MNDTEGTAAARPEDHVREFIKQLEHPETVLKTDTRRDGSDVWSGTSWGHAGRDAILARLKRAEQIEAKLFEIRDVIPIDFLRRHDTSGATGPTEKLDLVAAVRDLVEHGRRWEARCRDLQKPE